MRAFLARHGVPADELVVWGIVFAYAALMVGICGSGIAIYGGPW